MTCKAKSYGGRLKHKSSGKSEGEKRVPGKVKTLSAARSRYSQSKDGNGGK